MQSLFKPYLKTIMLLFWFAVLFSANTQLTSSSFSLSGVQETLSDVTPGELTDEARKKLGNKTLLTQQSGDRHVRSSRYSLLPVSADKKSFIEQSLHDNHYDNTADVNRKAETGLLNNSRGTRDEQH